MVRFHSVEEIEHSAHSVPNVTAHAAMPNGALVGLTYNATSKVTKAPATGNDLYVVINTQTGDKEYETEKTIAAGEYVNLFKLANWVGKELYVDEANVTGTYSSISVGDTLTFDATTFKFKKASATTGDIKFTVMAKGGLATNYLTVLVDIA